jgi:hypothetical protein
MRFLPLAALALLTLTSPALDLPPGGTDIHQGRGLQASASQGVGIAEPLPTGNRITISAATPSNLETGMERDEDGVVLGSTRLPGSQRLHR